MYHPWRSFRDHFPDWTLVWAPMAGDLGLTTWRDKTVTLDPHQDQAQRRSTLAHELVHLERGPFAEGCREREERTVDDVAARRLITLDQLAGALVWAYDVVELARELWVDVEIVRVRMANLTEDEGRELERRLDLAELQLMDSDHYWEDEETA